VGGKHGQRCLVPGDLTRKVGDEENMKKGRRTPKNSIRKKKGLRSRKKLEKNNEYRKRGE